MKKLSKKETVKIGAFVLLALGLLIAGHALHLEEKVSIESLRDSLSKTGAWQFVLFAAIYCVAALIPFPTAVLSSAAGALWGAYLGTGMTVLSATLAACIPFLLARIMARKAVRNMIEKSDGASRCDRFAGRNGFMTVLIMRLIPVVPWDMVNYLSGLCSIRFRDYLLASLLGTIPASFTYNLIGASVGGTVDKTAVAAVAAITALFAIVILIIKKRSGAKGEL
jgi:uncharacterized membrane protein YdjX (TVP38/TMEM64 family)